jgi:hypothetical protein
MQVDELWLATLTKNQDDAGTDAGKLNLIVNINGDDVFDKDFEFMSGSGWLSGGLGPDSGWLDQGQAALTGPTKLTTPFDSNQLTPSSVRLGNRSDDAWGPDSILVMGTSTDPKTQGQVIALAMETDLQHWLSTDSSEGKLTMPIPNVGWGDSATVIQRVVLLVYTGAGSDVQTDSPIQLQIVAAGSIVLEQQIPDTSQDDLEQYTGNWYVAKAAVPFTKQQVTSNGSIRLSILGDDAWVPSILFLYGLDTVQGRPDKVVLLSSIPTWNLGTLSSDPQEGSESVDLPVAVP